MRRRPRRSGIRWLACVCLASWTQICRSPARRELEIRPFQPDQLTDPHRSGRETRPSACGDQLLHFDWRRDGLIDNALFDAVLALKFRDVCRDVSDVFGKIQKHFRCAHELVGSPPPFLSMRSRISSDRACRGFSSSLRPLPTLARSSRSGVARASLPRIDWDLTANASEFDIAASSAQRR